MVVMDDSHGIPQQWSDALEEFWNINIHGIYYPDAPKAVHYLNMQAVYDDPEWYDYSTDIRHQSIAITVDHISNLQYNGTYTVYAKFTYGGSELPDPLSASFAFTNTGAKYAPYYTELSDTSTGNPTSWLWTFIGATYSGGETTSTEQNPHGVISYPTAGSYTITLEVRNATETSIVARTFNVLNEGDSPISDTISRENKLQAEFEYLFYEDGDILTWNFGDGTTSTEKSPTHIFDKKGKYLITLTVNSN